MNFPNKIKGLSEARKMPRLGKIRLGMKVAVQGQNVPTDPVALKKGIDDGTIKSRPKEAGFFVCPHEVIEKLNALRMAQGLQAYASSDEVTELTVMFPVNDVAKVFPQAYEMYGKGAGLKCIGNGETAERKNDTTFSFEPYEPGCPCKELKSSDNPTGACTAKAHLMAILPEVNMGGIYQIDTGSVNAIIDLNSAFEYVASLLKGRIAGVPLKLRRVPITTHHKGQAQSHFTLKLSLDLDITQLAGYYRGQHLLDTINIALPEPERVDPAGDECIEIESSVMGEVVDVEALAQMLKSAADMETFLSVQAEVAERGADLPDQDKAYLQKVAQEVCGRIEAGEKGEEMEMPNTDETILDKLMRELKLTAEHTKKDATSILGVASEFKGTNGPVRMNYDKMDPTNAKHVKWINATIDKLRDMRR